VRLGLLVAARHRSPAARTPGGSSVNAGRFDPSRPGDAPGSVFNRRWHAANLFFQLVSSRYEHASLILPSNLPFSGWGGVFGDQAVAAAMIDRIVHHADVLTLKCASYRLRGRSIDSLSSIRTTNQTES
jgi:hypothetical protein